MPVRHSARVIFRAGCRGTWDSDVSAAIFCSQQGSWGYYAAILDEPCQCFMLPERVLRSYSIIKPWRYRLDCRSAGHRMTPTLDEPKRYQRWRVSLSHFHHPFQLSFSLTKLHPHPTQPLQADRSTAYLLKTYAIWYALFCSSSSSHKQYSSILMGFIGFVIHLSEVAQFNYISKSTRLLPDNQQNAPPPNHHKCVCWHVHLHIKWNPKLL